MKQKTIVLVGKSTTLDNLKVEDPHKQHLILLGGTQESDEIHLLAEQAKENFSQVEHKIIQEESVEKGIELVSNLCKDADEDACQLILPPQASKLSIIATSAAHMLGIPTLISDSKENIHLPIINESAGENLGTNKLSVLESCTEEDFISMQEISQKLGMSIALLSYHINGTAKHKGLKTLRLLETMDKKRKLYLKRTVQGSIVVNLRQKQRNSSI